MLTKSELEGLKLFSRSTESRAIPGAEKWASCSRVSFRQST
jgi:hypothetical protein